MATESVFDPEPSKGRELNPTMIGMLITLLMVMGAAGFFGWKSVKVERENEQLAQTVDELMIDLDRMTKQAEKDKAHLMSTHQEEVDRLNSDMTKLNEQWVARQGEWERQLVAREEEHRERLQRSFDTLASVVNDSGSTLDYLREMDSKVKKGQTLRSEEVEQLKAIAKGLSYLQAQYEKPLEEFRELEKAIQSDLAESEAAAQSPEERKLLRTMFDWRYREQQRAEKLKEQGRREALEDTHQEVATRYARAQKEMAAIKGQFGSHMKNLDQLVAVQSENTVDMSSFFEMSAEMIKIHQRVMNLQVEPLPSTELPLTTGPETTVKP